ncbi:MAG: PAS domain S-box protein [Candidatus Aegiribacteria sp.]|nr:PAS domain S-box protein [Candidatus Aegiribacteria sp.]
MKMQNNSSKEYLLDNLCHDKSTSYKIIISITFGLLGFALNFFPVDFIFYGSYRMSFLFGLVFPMLITLAWGWKYGLLSALCGGCQTMWILWLPGSGYGPLVSVPPFTLWIVWLGWFSSRGRNVYLGEVIFRVFNTLLLYTVFRWVFTFNSPPANLEMPIAVVNSIVFKEIVNGFLILSLARGFLYSKTVREFFGLQDTRTDPRVYYVFLNILILAVMLTLILLGERFLWSSWSAEFRNMARFICSLLLLVAGAFCLYGAAGEFVRRKIEGVLERERNQLEEIVRERTSELRENQTRLAQIVQGSSMPIIVIDRDHIVTHWNRACERLTGIPANEIVGTGKHWSAFYPEERPILADIVIGDSPELEISKYYGDSCWKSVLIDGAYDAESFFHDLGENGKWLHFSAAVLRDSQGNITGAIETFQDVTGRKQAEEELRKAHDELEIRVEERTADLNASNSDLEAFSYSVSHDLRAPLRSIDGFSKLLLEEHIQDLNEQGIHYLERVRAGAQNMGALIDDMLTLSRLGREPLSTETVGMTTIAEEALELLRDEWKDRKVDFTFHDCPNINVDPDLMRIVLVNLLSNALKFSRNTDSAIIELGHRIMDNQTVFFLSDNGIGFNMKYADRIFAPFQRLHRSEEYEGSGIGLSSVKRIIDSHGGRIWIESGSDSGTTVFFTIPGS